jgi:hypothetical protein
VNGQASTDYAAILLVVAVLVAAAAALADGTGIAEEVRRQMARALCVVRGGECEVDRRPCVTALHRHSEAKSLSIVIFKVGHDRAIVREERSDGTIAVTLLDRHERGLQTGVGGFLRISLGSSQLSFGGEATASGLAASGRGTMWIVGDRSAADALVDVLGHPDRVRDPEQMRRFPPPTAVISERGLSTSVSGWAGRGGLGASLGLTASDTFGTRVEPATGRRTYYVGRKDEWSASASLNGYGKRVGQDPGERYAITVDRDGRPLDLTVITTGTHVVSTSLPNRLQPVAGLLFAPAARRGRTYVEEAHLDLTDPENLRVARAFLNQVRHPRHRMGEAVEVSRALAARLDAVGVIDVRAYEAESRVYGVEGGIGEGIRVGGSVIHGDDKTRLVSAATRGIDGSWRRRTDCLAQA